MKPVIALELSEVNVVKLVLDFLQEKELFVSQASLEKETGVTNFTHNCDDAVFLRELLFTGNWDDVIDFLQPLFEVPEFPRDVCTYIVLKGKYLEMLCLKAEIAFLRSKGGEDFSEIVKCLKQMESCCPSKEEFRDVCYLLSLNNLNENPQYSRCTPHSIRAKCFMDLLPIVEPHFPFGKSDKQGKTSNSNRLKSLLIKGILYETCVELCTNRALSNDSKASERIVADASSRSLLCGPELSDADAGLVSWLESLPSDVYLLPFEQRSLELRFQSLEANLVPAKPSWAEYIVSQNQVEKSRLLGVATSTRLQLQSASECRSSSDRVAPQQSTLEPALRKTFTSQSSVSQSLVSAYTNAKLSNGSEPKGSSQDKPSYQSFVEQIGSNSSLQHAPSPVPTTVKAEATTSTATTFSATRSPVDRKMGLPPSPVPLDTQIQNNTTSQELVVSSAKISAAAAANNNNFHANNTECTTENVESDQIKAISNGQTPQFQPTVSVGRSTTAPPRARSTSPPVRTRHDGQPPTVSESVKSLLQFTPVTVLEDTQPVRAIAIHQPSGKFYAVGSNSRNLRICYYPDVTRHFSELEYSSRDAFNNVPVPAKLVLQIQKYHRGSIFCLAWNSRGDLLASGSNDKSVKLIHFDAHHQTVGSECEFTHHDATVRDLCFVGENDMLISAGQGDCRVYLTDCGSQRVVRAFSGHTDHVFSVCGLPGSNSTLVSGSRDKTVRVWDLASSGNSPVLVIETPSPVNSIHASAILSNDSRVTSASSSSSYLLASGLANGICQLRDLRVPNRILAAWQAHQEEIRSVSLHPSLPFILSGSYDSTVALTTLSSSGGVIDLQHISNTHKVGVHLDKVVKCCWHSSATAPLSFLSASADKTVVCWVQQQYQPLQKSTTSHIPTTSFTTSEPNNSAVTANSRR